MDSQYFDFDPENFNFKVGTIDKIHNYNSNLTVDILMVPRP